MSKTSVAPLLLNPSQASRLSAQSTVFLDATWVMPNSSRSPKEEFQKYRIPNARYLDLDEVASHTEEGAKLGLKHMMPEPEVFAKACEQMGISRDTHVVLYDSYGIFSSARALFTFRTFSHLKSSILDGGLPRWIDEGHQVENSPISPESISKAGEPASYPTPSLDDSVIRSYAEMVSNSSIPQTNPAHELVLDARSYGRWSGKDPEPRPGMSSGHIPGSLSLPFTQFTDFRKIENPRVAGLPSYLSAGWTTLRSPEELSQEIRKAVGSSYGDEILDGQRKVVTTCGSGITAAILWLGISRIWEAQQRLDNSLALYDESWLGYAGRKESVIAKNLPDTQK